MIKTNYKIRNKGLKPPFKLGFKDGSGKESYWITDSADKAIIHGQGDCCGIGGIQDEAEAKIIVKALNSYYSKI